MDFIIAICPRCRIGLLYEAEFADRADGRECPQCGKMYTREKYRISLEAEPLPEEL